MRTLILYYSNTGNTQHVSEALAQRLDADLGEITCAAYLGWYGTLAMGWDMFTRHRPQIEILTPPGAHYDLTVIGGPVWAGRAAPPVMRALADHGRDLGRVALFVTCDGTSSRFTPERAIADMAATLPAPPVATQIFRQAGIISGAYRVEVAEFAKTLRSEAASPEPLGSLKPQGNLSWKDASTSPSTSPSAASGSPAGSFRSAI
jgi:hypothetical protein